jgi:hypothetical protein
MKFNRLKTKREYHDSIITAVNWRSDNDFEITIALDTHWNKSSPETCAIQFLKVRNRPDIEAALQQIASNQTHRRWIAEIVAFRRYGKTSYILYTTPQPPLVIDCASYIEV